MRCGRCPSGRSQAYTPEGKPAIDAWGKPVKRAAKPDVYARIVVDFCKRAKERSGAAPEIIGIQNEVEQPPEVFAEMTTAVRKALDAAGFPVDEDSDGGCAVCVDCDSSRG